MNIKDCLKKGFLKKISPDKELSKKELAEGEYDLRKAEESFHFKDYKWSIVKSYYSMFHIAKALLFKLGYAKKKHIAVLVVLEELNKQGKIEAKYVINFKASMTAREEADYNYSYSREASQYELESTKEFHKEIKRLINKEF